VKPEPPRRYTRRQGLVLGAALTLKIPKALSYGQFHPPGVSLSLRHRLGDARAWGVVLNVRELTLYSSHDFAEINVPRSPGSLIKLWTAEVALQRRVITPSESLFCPGWRDFGDGSRRPCWDSHGPVRMREALAQSCNVYFYEVGERLGSPVLYQALADSHLATIRTGQAPLLVTGEDPQLRVTPLGLLTWLHRLITAPLTPERDQIRQGMVEAVTSGTCQGLQFPGGVAAKTGTILHQGRFQGWVAAYAPIRDPRWLILVHVPTGRAAEVGIPAAQRVLSWIQALEPGEG